ncbi:hypothetical protein LAZ67_17001123 [Cordylochernes scorpioides]|uniref:Fatty acyl-CoA reductase n=1 Tax=Cordylochernes scorpioides TaxID=51811 RepID=A0ABY6LFW1_9ARAC|nr:hypothetical protein LAZ67_17001123 [Cordylochernes scorpioides]
MYRKDEVAWPAFIVLQIKDDMVRQILLQKESDPSGAVGSPVDSPIGDFYRDRCIFITGATGFLGKVLLEKLLRSCSGIKTIYVLLRGKDDLEPRQRLDELFSMTMFSKVRWENPSAISRVIPVAGDVTLPDLGLSATDLYVLSQNVSVIFHCAATVRFDEPYKKAVDINLKGTKHLLNVAKKMTCLSAMVHVSTAYSFCNKSDISEEIYPEPVDPDKILEASEWMDEKLLGCLMEPLLAGRPSNYHLTKAFAEILVQKECGGIPTAIVRPSIVTAAAREPIPGWVDNMYGPSGFIFAACKGALRTMHVYPEIAVDCIPVDYVSNMLITVGWHLGTRRPNAMEIYHSSSGGLNTLTWGQLERATYSLALRHPPSALFRYPGGSFKSSRLLNELSLKLEHHFPAQILDLGARLMGQEPQYVLFATLVLCHVFLPIN